MLGVSIGTSVGGCSNVRLTINLHGHGGEYSDWGFSDVVVWNRVLPYAEMKKVSDAMLKSVCGGSHYWNSVTNVCAACPVNSISIGSSCTCVGNTYFNSLSSTCDPYFSDGVIGDAPWGIWRAQSYDAGSPLVLRESRGNGRDITISGNITISNSSGNGALNPVYSLQGGTTSTMLWPTEFTGDFTICSMTRYTGSSNRQRILTSSINNWLHGHWGYSGAHRGVGLHGGTWVTYVSSRGTLTDWLVMCGQNSASNSTAAPNNIIADGIVNF